MLSKNLTCHISTHNAAVRSMRVEVASRPQGALYLSYELTGDLAQIHIPAPQPAIATDGLWQHTCFEAFIAVEGETRYHEFNFSPSGQWAAYAFRDYRERSAWTVSQTPVISFTQNDGLLQLEAVIAVADLPQNIACKPFQLGLTAVIEAIDGSRSYWALHHPDAHPNFHHRAGFILSFNQI